MLLYNTLNRKKEELVPVTPGAITMYACGITAYDLCHIGHARSAVVFDVLSRYLRYKGLHVTFVRNFTDVDDKIIARANREGLDSRAVAEKYIDAFHADMDRLGVQRADIEPKATEHIPDMIALCETLIAKGNAYATASGDVYFRVRTFPGYGKLSGRDIDDMRSGARVAPGEEKEDPLDFALWKSAKPGEPFWESPWGKGRPGWHIECSAMSEKHLPIPMDIHGGGQDLIFPHHENEIAQSEAALGKEFARYWVHNGFVQVDSEKMSKSLGNFRTIRDILESYQPETLRFFLIGKHYRSPIDFTAESMEEAEKGLKRLYEAFLGIENELAKNKRSGASLPVSITQELQELQNAWFEAMEDDLNTAAALGHMFAIIRLVNRVLEDKTLRMAKDTPEFLHRVLEDKIIWNTILGVCGEEPSLFLNELKKMRVQRKKIPLDRVEKLMEERAQARRNKDFAKSDALRQELTELGVSVRDTPQGAEWDIP